jgi:hypothetical protein
VVAFAFSMIPQGKIAASAPNEVLPMNPADDILTPKQLAERLRAKPTWVYEMCPLPGRLPGKTNAMHAHRKIFALLLAGHLRVANAQAGTRDNFTGYATRLSRN